MLILADLVTIGHATIVDELGVLDTGLRAWGVSLLWLISCLEGEDELLDDMVAMQI